MVYATSEAKVASSRDIIVVDRGLAWVIVGPVCSYWSVAFPYFLFSFVKVEWSLLQSESDIQSG